MLSCKILPPIFKQIKNNIVCQVNPKSERILHVRKFAPHV